MDISMGIGIVIAALATGVSPVGADDAGERPLPLVVAAGGDSVRATLGTYCVSDADSGMCSDSAYPLEVHGRLEVASGKRLTLRTHDAGIGAASASLLRVRGDRIRPVGHPLRVEPVRGHPRRFKLTLDEVGRANRLDVFVRYVDGGGDADYWARIAPR
jgi:hypothetical protein